MQAQSQDTPPQPQKDGLLFACILNGKGGAREVDWAEIEAWQPSEGALWVHLDRSQKGTKKWLTDSGGLSKTTAGAFLEEESRPRVFRGKKGYIAILRGINQNPDAEREDMVALRIWCDGERVFTARQRQLFVPRQIFTALTKEAVGPTSAAELFCLLIDRLIRQMSEIITEYSESLDEMELLAETDQSSAVSRKLADFRGHVVELRRYVAPQREALAHLLAEPPAWLSEDLRSLVRESADRQQRHLEELDSLRERSIVIKDDIANMLNEVMNRNMYVISIIAAIFLPLSFVTGLLGINVGGMPGVDNTAAFWITCAIMVVILVAQIWLFRKFKWL